MNVNAGRKCLSNALLDGVHLDVLAHADVEPYSAGVNWGGQTLTMVCPLWNGPGAVVDARLVRRIDDPCV